VSARCRLGALCFLATCDESLRGKRDRALLLFAWATGGRRRSEGAAATLENLQRVNAEAFVYTLAHSKTNQRGELRPEDVKPLVGSAAAAMTEWLAVLQAHGVQEGPIFRRIRKGGIWASRSPRRPCATSSRSAARRLRHRGGQAEHAAAGDDGHERAPERCDGGGVFPSGECVEQQSQQDA